MLSAFSRMLADRVRPCSNRPHQGRATVLQARADHEQQVHRDRFELQTIEKRLLAREEAIDLRNATIEGRSADIARTERALLDRKQQLSAQETEFSRLTTQAGETLEHIAGLTRDEAKRVLVEQSWRRPGMKQGNASA